MKAILEFNLPEEQDEFKKATDGSALASAICEFDQELRSALKYDSKPKWDKETTEEIRSLLNEYLSEFNLY